ncbi:MAG: hypothetical protein AAGF90_00970 [Pseudomonadota bacterium]
MIELLIDLVRMAHLGFFAVGVGCAVFMEGVVLSRARTLIDLEEIALIERGHRQILYSLAGLWATGLILIGVRTGLDPAAITPKLYAKLAVVTALTINALLIGRIAIPMLERALYGDLSRLKAHELAALGAVAGLSAAGWFSGLALGVVGHLKTASPALLWPLFGLILGGGAIAGAILSLRAGRIGPEAPLLPLAHLKALLGSRRGARNGLHTARKETTHAPISGDIWGRA